MSFRLNFFAPLLFVLLLPACSEKSGDSKEIIAGELIYSKNCKVCHAQGLNGAPILGNNKMWNDRATQALPTLVEHAANGYGLMPAKGGNENLTNQDLEQAITYMLSTLHSK